MSKALVNGTAFARLLGARFTVEADGSIRALVTVAAPLEGPPGYAHGGTLVALLDEAMGAAVWYAGHRVLAVHLASDFKRPVPLGADIRIVGQVERREGRKLFTSGAIFLPDDTLAVSGSGIFVEAPQVLQDISGFSFTHLSE